MNKKYHKYITLINLGLICKKLYIYSMENYEQRQFMIFNVSELQQIDFSQVLETSSETVRKSIDLTKTFVKWNGDIPNCVDNLTTKEGPYTYSEILTILSNSEWTDVNMSIQWVQCLLEINLGQWILV